MKPNVTAAVQSASAMLREFYGSEAKDVRLEEVVPEETTDNWFVTLSFSRFPDRDYKEFEIGPDGEVVAMRIKQLT